MTKNEVNYVVGKNPCKKCKETGGDSSNNNFHFYGEGRGGYCFACGYTETSEDYKQEWDLVGKPFTEDVIARIRNLSTDPDSYRGLTQETCRVYNTRHEYIDGKLHAQYYMATQAYKCSGFKLRVMPKDFDSYGTTGKACEMFGQYAFRNSNSKTVVVVGGEIDAMSAYQMLYNSQKSKEYEAIPVVSSTIGEGGTAAQLAAQYEWLNRFEKVILCLDNDDAGRKATEECVAALPKGKAYKMDLTLKDANEYLTSFREREFVQAFWSAKQIVPAGVVGSTELYGEMLKVAGAEKIPLPRFMNKLEKMLGGGFTLGHIINFASSSGVGKTSVVNEMLYFWMYHCPYKLGVVSMELNAGQYGLAMLSRHTGVKINKMSSKEQLDFLSEESTQLAIKDLLSDENGKDRWMLVDDRDGSIEQIKGVIESLVISCGCQIIVLDPMSDIIEGMSNEDQSLFIKWQKGMIKSHNVTFVNICHTRKTGSGEKAGSEGALLTEESIFGSSSIFKSSSANILFSRNKYAEDPIERNTITVRLSKNRAVGETGDAGKWFYDFETSTLYDYDEWEAERNKIPGEYDASSYDNNPIEYGGVTFNVG